MQCPRWFGLRRRLFADSWVIFLIPVACCSGNPPSAIVDAVAKGTIDVAIVWGPIGSYYAARQKVPLAVTQIPSKPGDLPFAFNMTMGVKKGNDALFMRLEALLQQRRPEIEQILKDFNVPLLPRKVSPKR